MHLRIIQEAFPKPPVLVTLRTHLSEWERNRKRLSPGWNPGTPPRPCAGPGSSPSAWAGCCASHGRVPGGWAGRPRPSSPTGKTRFTPSRRRRGGNRLVARPEALPIPPPPAGSRQAPRNANLRLGRPRSPAPRSPRPQAAPPGPLWAAPCGPRAVARAEPRRGGERTQRAGRAGRERGTPGPETRSPSGALPASSRGSAASLRPPVAPQSLLAPECSGDPRRPEPRAAARRRERAGRPHGDPAPAARVRPGVGAGWVAALPPAAGRPGPVSPPLCAALSAPACGSGRPLGPGWRRAPAPPQSTGTSRAEGWAVQAAGGTGRLPCCGGDLGTRDLPGLWPLRRLRPRTAPPVQLPAPPGKIGAPRSLRTAFRGPPWVTE